MGRPSVGADHFGSAVPFWRRWCGFSAQGRRGASALRERILAELCPSDSWWNAATRAEALIGLGRYPEATDALSAAKERPSPWERQTTARQLAHLVGLREPRPLEVPAIRGFFDKLLPGAADAAASAVIGKVGLALSGGGFRASFFHLGVLAQMAELDVRQRLAAADPSNAGWQRDLAVSHFKLFQLAQENSDEAMAVAELRACYAVLHGMKQRGLQSAMAQVYEQLEGVFNQ